MPQDSSGPSKFVIVTWGLAALLLLTVIVIGGWQLGWWLNKANANKQYEVNTHTQQYQAGLIATERDAVIGWNNANDPNQKAFIKQTFCTQFLNLTQPPADLVFAKSKICL